MRKSAKFVLYGVVVASVVGGTAATAWANTDKTVAITVDGQARTIHTRAGTVGGALRDADIATGAHDVLAPAADSRIHDGSRVVLLKGRMLHLDIDGQARDVWTTAPTVDQALTELGFGADRTVSVSRSTRLPLTPTQIELLTPKKVTIVADKKTLHVITTQPTVAAVIADAGLRVGVHDRISATPASAPTDGEKVTITRIAYKTTSKKVKIPFATKTTRDSHHFVGTTIILKHGQSGVRKITYRLVYIDGELASKKVATKIVVKAPVTKVQKIGTKHHSTSSSSSGSSGSSSSAPVPSGSAQSIARAMVSDRGWSSSQFSCLIDLWNRESGWRTTAANPSGAYGIPQALPGSKMASAGPDWRHNATTQIKWGLGYISDRYGTPCGAWGHSQDTGWY